MKIQSSSLSFGTATAGQSPLPPRIETAHPMSVLLFGTRPPKLVDRRKHPKLRKALRKLEAVKDQIADFAGQSPEELSIALCEGNNACISGDGQISFGLELLERHQQDDDFLVGVLGHEIGHQPWSWAPVDVSRMTRRERDQLCCEEEAKADRFAGKVLAELGADPDSLCRFLLKAAKFETHPSTTYYPAQQRSELIHDGFRRRLKALAAPQVVLGELRPRTRDLR